MSIKQPKLITVPFAQNAGDTYKYDIENTNSTSYPNKATYEAGFPPVTMTSISAGGIPFFGQDMNGIFNELSAAIRYMQAGNYHTFNAELAEAIGGYNKGAIVLGDDGTAYQSAIDNNKQDPREDMTGWGYFFNGLSSATDSDSETTAATSKAVKDVAELANNALPLTGGTVTGNTNFTGKLQQSGSDVITEETILNYQTQSVVLYPGGSETSPSVISNNQRIVIENPFSTMNVYTRIELFINNVWGEVGETKGSIYITKNTYVGVSSSVNSEGKIVIQSAADYLIEGSVRDGNPFGTAADSYVASAKYRVRVIKIGE